MKKELIKRISYFSIFFVASFLFLTTLAATSVHAADIFVTTDVDEIIENGICSLREAVISANTDQPIGGCHTGNGADTIYLEDYTVYTLSIIGANEDASLTGDLDITDDLTIIGGANATKKAKIRGDYIDRVIHITGSSNVTFLNLNIEDGSAGSSDGGGIYNNGGALQLTAVSVSDCITDDNGGGLFNTSNGTVELNNGTIHHNTAGTDGGGVYNESGSITLTDSHVFENQANQDGGGVFNSENGTFNLVGTFDKAYMSSTSDYNSSESGGGIYNEGTLWLMKSEVRYNRVVNDGAGIYNTGRMTIQKSSIRLNTASGTGSNGGGIFNAHQGGDFDVWIQRSSIYQNTVSDTNATNGHGGGIYNSQDSTIGFINSTISSNISNSTGGGIYNNGTVSFQYCTIKDNSAGDNPGDGLFNAARAVVEATFRATIMDNSSEDNCEVTGNSVIVTNGFNIDSGNTCEFDPGLNDQINTNPMLDIYNDNGGPTRTHALLPGSPAIDEPGNIVCPQTDQRGVGRPAPIPPGTCDIGAYEFVGRYEKR